MRFYLIDYHSLSFDELIVVDLFKNRSLLEVLNELKINDTQQPFFYIISYYVEKFWGNSIYALRIPSIVFSFISLWQFYLLVRKIRNKHTALIATALMSVSGLAVSQSFEARPYSLLLLLSIVTSRYFFRVINQNGTQLKDYFYYFLFSLLLIYTHYYGVLLFISQMISLCFYCLIINKKFIKHFIFLSCGITLLFLPQMTDLWIDLNVKHTYRHPLTLMEFINSMYYLFSGYSSVVLILSFLTFIFFSRINGLNHLLKLNAICLFLFFFPLIIALLKGISPKPAYATKYLIIILPYLYILISSFLSELKAYSNVSFNISLLSVIAATIFHTLYFQNNFLYFPLVTETKKASDAARLKFNPQTTKIMSCNICLNYYLSDLDYDCWVAAKTEDDFQNRIKDIKNYEKVIFVDYDFKTDSCKLRDYIANQSINSTLINFKHMILTTFDLKNEVL